MAHSVPSPSDSGGPVSDEVLSKWASTLPQMDEGEWRAAAEAHRARLTFLDDYLDARSRGAKHPVLDFLFEYYGFRPARLRRWTPGVGVVLTGRDAQQLATYRGFRVVTGGVADGGVVVDPSAFAQKRVRGAQWVLQMLRNTQARPAFLGCHGLHEWAMVYRSESVRHDAVPLRLSRAETDAVVEQHSVRCTHYDAFRFFTPPARPLNVVQPQAESMADQEQPGCIHANMDVYRWAFKLSPWLASTLLADALELARSARAIDMRASPYDLRELGYEPICIETAQGRRAYREHQRELSEAAKPIRERVIAAYGHFLQVREELA